MYRGISCATAGLLVTIAVQSATADDASACKQATGDEAIAACTGVLALNPNNAVADYDRGTAYINKGDYDRAISDIHLWAGSCPVMLPSLRRWTFAQPSCP